MKNHLDCVELRILTPFPGTRIYTRLLSEGRLFVPDWWLQGYPPDTLLFQPRSMTVDELLEGFARLNRQVYSLGGVIKRFFGMSPRTRTALGCSVYFGFNLATRKRYIKSLGIRQPFVGASGQEEKTALGVRYE